MKIIKKIGLIMLKISIVGVFLFFAGNILGNILSNDKDIYKTNETVIVYLNKEEASNYLIASNYFNEQNRLSVSLKTEEDVQYTDNEYKEKYQKYVISNLNNWDGREKKYLNKRFAKIIPYIKKYTNQVLFDTIYLIKSNKKIEFSAPFTKRKAIIIPDKEIPPFVLSGLITKNIEHILIHELFHIFSSNNKEKREVIYNQIGFEKINQIELPNEILKTQIINPDDNISDYYKISLQTDGKNQDFIMLILSKYPKYEGYKGLISRLNILFGYMEIRLIPIEKENNHWNIKKNYKLYKISEVQGFYEKIGYIHNYILSPEEILADDYAKLIELKIHKNDIEELTEKDKLFFNKFEHLLK